MPQFSLAQRERWAALLREMLTSRSLDPSSKASEQPDFSDIIPMVSAIGDIVPEALIAHMRARLPGMQDEEAALMQVFFGLASNVPIADAGRDAMEALHRAAGTTSDTFVAALVGPHVPLARARALDQLIDGLASKSRAEALMALAIAMAPVTRLLAVAPAVAEGNPAPDWLMVAGGPPFAQEFAQALDDVKAWWP